MANKKDRPKYLLLEKWDNFEIRRYEPRIVAETMIQAGFEEAMQEGFNILAAYIFGQNATKTKIAMTAPVEQKADTENWKITFSMPATYQLEELPLPKDSRIALKQLEAETRAAYLFSGFCTEKKTEHNTKLLLKLLEEHGYISVGSCILARYDPPWTLPCFRHNELLFVIQIK